LTSAEAMFETLEEVTPDLIVLDIEMPEMDGYEAMKKLKADERFSDIPVIFLTAKNDVDSERKGFDLGAVDYIRKPFEWEELLARIRVIQKKNQNVSFEKINIEDLTIDVVGRKVTRAGKEIRLTAKEYLLLEYLARNANRIMSKEQIMERVWDLDFNPGSNIVEVHIYQLRRKVDREFELPLIETVVGLGYMLKGEKNANE